MQLAGFEACARSVAVVVCDCGVPALGARKELWKALLAFMFTGLGRQAEDRIAAAVRTIAVVRSFAATCLLLRNSSQPSLNYILDCGCEEFRSGLLATDSGG